MNTLSPTLLSSDSAVTAPCFYDDSHLALLLPSDLFLFVAPATFRSLLLNGYVFEKVGEGLLGASKRTNVAYNRDHVRSGELPGSAGLGAPTVGSKGPHSDRTGRNMLTTLHEHYLSFTQNFTYCLLWVIMQNYLVHLVNWPLLNTMFILHHLSLPVTYFILLSELV
jgi:hypothetical protein